MPAQLAGAAFAVFARTFGGVLAAVGKACEALRALKPGRRAPAEKLENLGTELDEFWSLSYL